MYFLFSTNKLTVASSVVIDARPVAAVKLGIPSWARGLRRRGNRGAGRQLGLG